jgi:hypothetical protein
MGPEEIIDAYRQARRPATEARAGNWDALQRRIDAGEVPRLPRPPRLDVSAPADVVDLGARRRRFLVAATLGLAAALVLVVSAKWRASTARPDGASAPMQAPDQRVRDRPQRAESATTGRATPRQPAPTEPTAVTQSAEAPPASTQTRRPRRPSASPRPPNVDAPGLREEMQLVERAKRALAAGDAAAAWAATEAHAKRFPDGVLAQERFATAIAALCALDREDAAAGQAHRYLAAFGDSHTAQKLAADPCPQKP